MRRIHQTLLALSAVLTIALSATVPGTAQSGAPVVSSFRCPLNIENGLFECDVTYQSSLPATVAWSASGRVYNSAGYSSLLGRCSIGRPFRVTVTISNALGSTSRSSTFNCY
jgi:hypothetical protein